MNSLKDLRRVVNHASLGRFRFYVQLFSFVLLIYGGYLAINVGNQLPTFACLYSDLHGGACYLLGFQHQMATPWSQLFGGRGLAILIGLATFVAFFVVFNKAWCGFICPLGTLQDWLSSLRRKLNIRAAGYSEPVFQRLSKIKYVLLALLILIPMAIGNSFFGLPKLGHDWGVPFCMICPGRTILPLFTGDFSQLAIDFSSLAKLTLTALGLAITGLLIIGSLFKPRFFCLFCPMSALHYIFSRTGLLRLTKNGAKCTRCGNCFRACDMGIRAIADDLESKNIVKDDCMMCGKCIEVCPEDGCLQAKVLSLPVYESTAEGFFKRMNRKNNG
ncbi:4Fe-4S binding protein [Desulfurivibrio dismutans]|uniref:4Fe-4S binding protein n=1 Tax=Desulfurivibrio dismutans TaxID=1398908 RepID=UPI0023D9CE1A|nr:4Fe-4S binding protein [Desulfurivibrio alkaliphilus]MDF1615063.1 4Fe-4S binding protein [Desulfurivibrio alkaliphilus]